MKLRGPMITLFVILAFGAVLLGVNMFRQSGAPSPPPAPASAQALPPAPPVAPPAAAPGDDEAPGAPAAPEAAKTPFPAQAKYTGYTDGDHGAIALTVRNNRVTAYLCDGKTLEAWYKGSAADGAVDAKSKSGGTLSGTLTDKTLRGTVTAKGKTWTYSAHPATSPAGLYRSATPGKTTGWIKDSSGKVTGLANEGGVTRPAGPLDPATAHSVEGDDQ
jgi:hypothetical protein